MEGWYARGYRGSCSVSAKERTASNIPAINFYLEKKESPLISVKLSVINEP